MRRPRQGAPLALGFVTTFLSVVVLLPIAVVDDVCLVLGLRRLTRWRRGDAIKTETEDAFSTNQADRFDSQ